MAAILLKESLSLPICLQIRESSMALNPGCLSQLLMLVVSIKTNQQTNGHKKLFRANTTSVVLINRLQNPAM